MIQQERDDWDRIANVFLRGETGRANGYLDTLPSLQQKRLLVALSALGDVKAKRVLVCGCGKGIETIQLLLRGAQVTTFDLSHGMCRLTRLRAFQTTPRPDLTPVQARFEQMPFGDGEFDCALGVDILHHLEDVRAGSRELRRVLRSNGRAIFIENWVGNPLLMFARKHLAGHFGIPFWGSRSEFPLDLLRFQAFAEGWEKKRLHFPVMFLFFKIVDNVIMGIFQHRSGRRGWAEGVLRWIWQYTQDVDWWLSHNVPNALKCYLSYTCQVELDMDKTGV